jgi:hypothetical protein
MNRYAERLLWAVGIVSTVAACALWLYGCGPAPKAASEPTVDITLAVACSEIMNQAVEQSATCQEAEKRINASAVCRELKPDGFNLKCKDGGA